MKNWKCFLNVWKQCMQKIIRQQIHPSHWMCVNSSPVPLSIFFLISPDFLKGFLTDNFSHNPQMVLNGRLLTFHAHICETKKTTPIQVKYRVFVRPLYSYSHHFWWGRINFLWGCLKVWALIFSPCLIHGDYKYTQKTQLLERDQGGNGSKQPEEDLSFDTVMT